MTRKSFRGKVIKRERSRRKEEGSGRGKYDSNQLSMNKGLTHVAVRVGIPD